MSTPTTTDIQIATDTDFNTLSINETKPYCTTRTFTPEELPSGVDLYMRVRHHTDDASMDTPWSDTRYFQIEPDAEIIGVCLDNSDTTKAGVWSWIDRHGNKLDSFTSGKYPIFANIETVTLDSERDATCVMMKIPTVYVKTMTSGPINTFAAGKKCWWISDKRAAGFHPHPAFKRTTEKDSSGKYIIANYDYISLNACIKKNITINGSTVTLFVSTPPRGLLDNADYYRMTIPVPNLYSFSSNFTYITDNEYVKFCTNHNDESSNQQGWRAFDGYDIALIQLLRIIRNLNFIDGGAAADENSDRGLVITLANKQFLYRMRRCPYLKDRMYLTVNTDNNNALKPALLDPADYTKKIIFSDDFICGAGVYSTGAYFIRDVLSGSFTIGNDIHDIMELFYANEFTTSALSSFNSCAYGLVNGNNQTGISDAVALLCHSALTYNGSNAGIFGYGIAQSVSQSRCFVRIAKN